MRFRRVVFQAVLSVMIVVMAGCVDQNRGESSGEAGEDLKLVATSPAVADICDKLELELIGVCSSTLSKIPERYDKVTQVGTAMSPDLEILKSLSPDYVLSPNSLQSDLQPKYSSAGLKSVFLYLKRP